MNEQHHRPEAQSWTNQTPDQVIEQIVQLLYGPVSLLGSQLKRLTDDEDPISEDEYEAIFATMHNAVNQLSKTVVQLKRYSEERKRAQS